jgi:hypothetical protein
LRLFLPVEGDRAYLDANALGGRLGRPKDGSDRKPTGRDDRSLTCCRLEKDSTGHNGEWQGRFHCCEVFLHFMTPWPEARQSEMRT